MHGISLKGDLPPGTTIVERWNARFLPVVLVKKRTTNAKTEIRDVSRDRCTKVWRDQRRRTSPSERRERTRNRRGWMRRNASRESFARMPLGERKTVEINDTVEMKYKRYLFNNNVTKQYSFFNSIINTSMLSRIHIFFSRIPTISKRYGPSGIIKGMTSTILQCVINFVNSFINLKFEKKTKRRGRGERNEEATRVRWLSALRWIGGSQVSRP